VKSTFDKMARQDKTFAVKIEPEGNHKIIIRISENSILIGEENMSEIKGSICELFAYTSKLSIYQNCSAINELSDIRLVDLTIDLKD